MCASFDIDKIARKVSLDYVPSEGSTFWNIYSKLLFPWQPNIGYVWLNLGGKRSIDILNE